MTGVGEIEPPDWQALLRVIDIAQRRMAAKLRVFLSEQQFRELHYARYLTMQYHLTRGVQRYFLTAAAHPDLAHRKPLRSFLFDFANEEELHFTIAERDLTDLGLTPSAEPFDVSLWHSHFAAITSERPFVRLGAACVLENLSAGEVREPLRQMLAAEFLTRDNTRFIVLHQHESIPHGDQILSALRSAELTQSQVADLVEGAQQGARFFLRFIDWALLMDEDGEAFEPHPNVELATAC